MPKRVISALSQAAHVHRVRGIGHERLEAVLRRPRQSVAYDDALNRSGASQVGDRLIDEHQRDRCDDDHELRKDAQLQLFYFDHRDGAPPGAELTPAIPTKRTPNFYAVRSGPSITYGGYLRQEGGARQHRVVWTESS